MSDLRTAAQQALEFCEFLWRDVPLNDYSEDMRQDVESALRAALAEPVQEPYCHVYEYDGVFGLHREFYPREHNGRKPDRAVPLFTAPQRKPVQETQCNPHPKAPHSFMRNASHTEDRYVCECEGWEPYEAGYQAGMEAALRAQS